MTGLVHFNYVVDIESDNFPMTSSYEEYLRVRHRVVHLNADSDTTIDDCRVGDLLTLVYTYDTGLTTTALVGAGRKTKRPSHSNIRRPIKRNGRY